MLKNLYYIYFWVNKGKKKKGIPCDIIKGNGVMMRKKGGFRLGGRCREDEVLMALLSQRDRRGEESRRADGGLPRPRCI